MKITITKDIRVAIQLIYDHLKAGKRRGSPIDHLVDRDQGATTRGDASRCAIGVVNDNIKYLVFLP